MINYLSVYYIKDITIYDNLCMHLVLHILHILNQTNTNIYLNISPFFSLLLSYYTILSIKTGIQCHKIYIFICKFNISLITQ